jgi:hypothetical protein
MVPGGGCLVLEIPFITLHLLYLRSKSVNFTDVTFLSSLDSYISSEECDLSSLCIIMFRLWSYHQISGNFKQVGPNFKVKASSLFPLRPNQPDIAISYRPNFLIKQPPYQITIKNFEKFNKSLQPNDAIAYINLPGAPYGDAIIFTDPPIVLQEKQSIVSRQNIFKSRKPKLMGLNVFNTERAKVQKEAIFVFVTDDRARNDLELSDNDILISSGSETDYHKFAGKLLALRQVTQLGLQSEVLASKE